MNSTMSFRDWLSNEIEERQLTRDEFATRVGVYTSTLMDWLSRNNPRVPQGRNIVRLARALGISRAEIESHLNVD